MNNRLLTALAISVICAGGAALAGQRLNTLNNLVEGPKQDGEKPAAVAGVAVVEGHAVAPVVWDAADGMTASQLVDWMKKQGYKFVVETTNLPKDRKFDVNLNGAKESDAISAIAEALGLSVSKKGDIYVLRDGLGFLGPDGAMRLRGLEGDFKFDELAIPHLKGDMLPELKSGLWIDGKALTDKQKAEVEKAMSEAHKAMGEMFKDGKHMADIEKAMSEAQKALGEALKEGKLKRLGEDGHWVEGRKLSEAEKKELESAMKSLKDGSMKVRIGEKIADAERLVPGKMMFKTAGIKSFMDSLTAKQKNLQAERGYLLISDLTEEQRELLGLDDSGGTMSLTFKIDGQSVTVKSSDKS